MFIQRIGASVTTGLKSILHISISLLYVLLHIYRIAWPHCGSLECFHLLNASLCRLKEAQQSVKRITGEKKVETRKTNPSSLVRLESVDLLRKQKDLP